MTKKLRSGKVNPASENRNRFTLGKVKSAEVAALILDDLSRTYSDVCNYLDAVQLLRQGEIYLAYVTVLERHRGVAVASPRSAWVIAQAEGALKKLVDPMFDRWPAVKDSWFSTEARCHRLNNKFQALANRRARGKKPVPFAHELYRFYELVHHVLGDTPDLDDIAQSAYYGPGSTVSVRGRAVHYVRKTDAWECTPLARELATLALSYDKAIWAQVGLDPTYAHLPSAHEGFRRVVRELLESVEPPHDSLMFIHKGIESMRSIGAQPTVSGMLQLGVHSHLTPKLKEIGIDLGDQDKNRRMAYLGSRDWEEEDPICTLDKTNASNLQALGLIQYLYPPQWAKLLQRLRTPTYTAPPELGGGVHTYGMYAGMGNGTTFVVETLTFAAIAYATSNAASVEDFVRNTTYAVYGDDVILRRSHAERYIRFASFLGFRINTKKTFLTGPFRESCGADFYNGVNVRPAIVEASGPFMHQLELIGIHNTLADQPHFKLVRACEGIRRLWKERLYPLVPTDFQGNLGFRPVGCSGYDKVTSKDGTVLISPTWQRPRYFVLDVKPKFEGLGTLDSWTEIAVALLRGRQSNKSGGLFSLPLRDLTTVRLTAEQDLIRSDLVLMLANQLTRLAKWKNEPWYEVSRGRG